VPLFVGRRRHVPSIGSVAVVNILTVWTFVGWVVALAMACRTVPVFVPIALAAPPQRPRGHAARASSHAQRIAAMVRRC
jgi:hypothetical protein